MIHDFAIGDLVEWDMSRGFIDRGTVSAITETRVYVRNQRVRTRGKGAGQTYDSEFWWDAHELGRLRKITTTTQEQRTLQTKLEEQARDIAKMLDRSLNRDGKRSTGFALLMFAFGDPPQPATWISNADRGDMIHAVETGRVRNFCVDIKITCLGCGLPFQFLGTPTGHSFKHPTVDVIATTLSAPIAPGERSLDQLPRRLTFEMPPTES